MVSQLQRFLASGQGALGRRGLVVLALVMIAVGALAMAQWSLQIGADLSEMVAPPR